MLHADVSTRIQSTRIGLGRRTLAVFAVASLVAISTPAMAVPSFARQTGMACAACHTVFPELTPFGREFKLNGYVLDNIKQIKGINIENRSTLALNSLPPISVMLQVSYTHTGSALPDSNPGGDPALSQAFAKDGDVLFPQQASIFYAGKIADGLGAFMQLTYDGVGDSFGFDNTDIRYARHLTIGGTPSKDPDHPDTVVGGQDLVLGITVNNSPTVQDVWNTTAAWGFPYAGSSVAPGAITSTKLEAGGGGLGQSAGGAGVYAWWNNSLYAELSLYTAAIRGGTHPLDSGQAGVIHGVSPYWRLAYESRWDRNSLMIGTYGIDAHIHPGNGHALAGPIDQYRDVAGDIQYQFIGEDHIFTVLTTYIHENQSLDASFASGLAANSSNTLKTFKIAGEYTYQRMIGGSLGFFTTSGSSDANLYAPAAVSGSALNSPDTQGQIAELNYLPWLNTKLQLQYTRYTKFNGSGSNYDGAARNAGDNNTLYLLVWLNY